MRNGLLVAGTLTVLALAGCSAAASGPAPCEWQFPADRCQRMAEVVADGAGVPVDLVRGIDVVPTAAPQFQPMLGSPGIHLRLSLADGSTLDGDVCVGSGIGRGLECTDDPHLWVGTASEGYRDVFPDTSPVPSADPAAVASAVPLHVGWVRVPIDHTGPYEVPLGTGSLPNGILTKASATLVDDWPEDINIRDARIRLDLRSLEQDGRPFDNLYRHGWRPGVERFAAFLVFDVRRYSPGAVMELRDISVR